MTKAELIAAMADQAGISRDQARLALEAFTATTAQALARGDDVRIVGFGVFTRGQRKAGPVRNPKTGEVMMRPSSHTARFRPGEGLKSALNG